MANKCEITDPGRAFYYCHRVGEDPYRGQEWLGVDIRGYELEGCDTLWIRSYRPEPGRFIHHPPDDFTPDDFESQSLRLGLPQAMKRLLPPDTLPTSNDLDTVCFGLDLHDLDQSEKDLSTIQYLFIPCDSLKEAEIPGFGGGCGP